MWNLLFGGITRLNIHVHMYVKNNFIRTTNQLKMEKRSISNSYLFCFSPSKLYICWLPLCVYGREFSYVFPNVVISGLQFRKLRLRNSIAYPKATK